MRYYLLGVLLGLASFAIPSLGAALGVCAAWPRLRSTIERLPPRPRVRSLLALRACPTVVGGLSVAALTSAFLRHEPRQTNEEPGLLLIVAATAAVPLVALIAKRGMREAARAFKFNRVVRHCRRLRRAGGASICIVETAYPVAAVAGVVHPRVLLSARILRECTEEELDAIVAHEQAHIRCHHNLVRAFMRGLPDPLAVLCTGREIEADWALAAEETADGDAAGSSEERRAILAAALVRVARMADDVPPLWMPALAFYNGQDLEHRVSRLLDAPLQGGKPPGALHPTVLGLAVGCLAWSEHNSDVLHRAVEWMVRSLP